ncbi:MAG: hypothetical protein J6I61_06955 [Prevotella sp.]|nr:hypothetical protein [Prevotella sp.]
MKKIILLFAMMLAVAGVQAVTRYIPLLNPTMTNCSWDAESKQMTINGSDNSLIFPVGKVDNYTKVNVCLQGFTTGSVRIALVGKNGSYYAFGASGKDVDGTAYGSAGIKTFDVANSTVTSAIGSITGIKIYCGSNSGTINIPYISFENVSDETLSNTTNLADYSSFTFNNGTASDWRGTVSTFPMSWSSGGRIAGTNDLGSGYQVDVTSYNAIYFSIPTVTTVGNNGNGGTIRVAVQKTGSEESAPIVLYAKKYGESVADWTSESGVKEAGLYYVDLKDVHYLNSIKLGTQSSPVLTIKNVYLAKKSVTLTDGKDICEMVYDPIGASVPYNRTFNINQKSTVCLPFALTADEVTAAGKFYELSSADGTTLHFTQVSTTEAYKPYVFEATTANPFASLSNKAIVASAGATTSDEVGGYTFQGTLVHQNVPNGAYGYNASTGAFSKATSDDVTIDAFRAYIITSTSSARSLDLDFGDGTTSIEKVKKTENNYDSIYNLSGQSVSPNYKGIVIKNGKKMIQK